MPLPTADPDLFDDMPPTKEQPYLILHSPILGTTFLTKGQFQWRFVLSALILACGLIVMYGEGPMLLFLIAAAPLVIFYAYVIYISYDHGRKRALEFNSRKA